MSSVKIEFEVHSHHGHSRIHLKTLPSLQAAHLAAFEYAAQLARAFSRNGVQEFSYRTVDSQVLISRPQWRMQFVDDTYTVETFEEDHSEWIVIIAVSVLPKVKCIPQAGDVPFYKQNYHMKNVGAVGILSGRVPAHLLGIQVRVVERLSDGRLRVELLEDIEKHAAPFPTKEGECVTVHSSSFCPAGLLVEYAGEPDAVRTLT